MSADAFHVCYGLRWEMDAHSPEVVLLEARRDPRQLAARQHKLGMWWGMTATAGRFVLLIGYMAGHFGWEGDHAGGLTRADISRIMAETEDRLRLAGFQDEPAWYFQFEPDQ